MWFSFIKVENIRPGPRYSKNVFTHIEYVEQYDINNSI